MRQFMSKNFFLIVLAFFASPAVPVLPVRAQTTFTPTPANPSGYVFHTQASGATTAQITALQSRIATLNATVNTLNAAVSAKTGLLTAAQSTITSLTSQRDAAEAALQTAQDTLATVQGQLTAAQAALASSGGLAAQLADAQASVTSLTSQRDAALSSLATAQSSLATVQGQLTTALADKAALQASLTASQASLTASQTSLANAQAQIVSLTASNSTLSASNTSLTNQLSTANAESAALAAALAAAQQSGAAPRLVFQHDIPGNAPNSYYFQNYGEDYLLSINQPASVQAQEFVATGADGLMVDLYTFTGASDAANMSAMLTQADSLGYSVALCLDSGGRSDTAQLTLDVERGIESYVTTTIGHVSAQVYNGKPVVWTYSDFPADFNWATVKAKLVADGKDVSFYGDVGGVYLQNNTSAVAVSMLTANAASFEQLYSFGPSGGTGSYGGSNLLSGLVATGKPFAWTNQPGYLRAGVSWTDAQGTGTLQSGWNNIFNTSFRDYATQCRAALISTWNDFAEETYDEPSSNWNWTRTDETAWYTAKFKGKPAPFTDTRQYLTVPQCLYSGQSAVAEVTVINPSDTPATLTASVINSYSQQYSGFGNLVAPHTLARFTATLTDNAALVSGMTPHAGAIPVLRIKAVLKNALTGAVLTTTLSPPCAVTTVTSPHSPAQTEYYSLASHKAMDGGNRASPAWPTGSINISPSGVRTVTMNPIAGYASAGLDLLHNTRLEYSTLLMQDSSGHSLYTGGSVTGKVYTPMNKAADNRGDTVDYGFYVIRERTADGHEVYSDPIVPTHN